MTLAQFVAEHRERLEAFEDMWLAEHSAQQGVWPLELPPDDWHDLFMIFVETQATSPPDARINDQLPQPPVDIA